MQTVEVSCGWIGSAANTTVRLFLLLLSGFPSSAVACDFPYGWELGPPPLTPALEGEIPPDAPRIEVLSLERGFNDGQPFSCSDAGILTLVVRGPDSGRRAGYLFELVESRDAFPDQVLPDLVIAPIELGDGLKGFRFVWLDLPHGQRTLSPVDVVIEVRLIVRPGLVSEPTRVEVKHPGGRPSASQHR